MRPFKGLSVDIATQSGPLTLHNDPDDDTSDELYQRYTCQRYVEAVTGATFKVKVSVHKSFPLRRMELDDAVHIEILYDDQKLSWIMDFTRATIMQRRSEGKPVEQTFSQIATFSEETQQWKQGATTFGALDMKETADSRISLSDVQNLGRIQVKVERVHRSRQRRPHRSTIPRQEPVTEVTEKVLKGKSITNTVRVTNEVPGKEPLTCLYDYTPIYGDYGRPLIYNILYRSRNTLQMLGCIPRSPTPEPQTTRSISPATSREQRIRDLRAQLALLEGDGNVKAEGSGSRAIVKREMEDTANTGSRKRPRKSGTIETVDLTDD